MPAARARTCLFVDHAHDKHDQQCHSNDHEVKLVNTERLEERIVKDGECKSGDHGAEHLHTCAQAVCTEKQLADDDQHRRAQHLQQTVREALARMCSRALTARTGGAMMLPPRISTKWYMPKKR